MYYFLNVLLIELNVMQLALLIFWCIVILWKVVCFFMKLIGLQLVWSAHGTNQIGMNSLWDGSQFVW